jgi:signal transduction histidine kinase
MESRVSQSRLLAVLTALLMVAIASVAVREAVVSYDMPIGGLLVTPDGVVSNTGLPTWSGVRQGLRFPNRILRADGEELVSHSRADFPARVFDCAVARAAREGRSSIRVEVQNADSEKSYDLTIERLGPLAWWTYAGVLFFVGALYFAAGLIAILAGRAPLARAFSKLAIFLSVFMFVLFDFHTTRTMAPLFWLVYPMVPLSLIGLALRLPDDVELVKNHPWILRLLDAVGLVLAAGMILAGAAGRAAAILNAITSPLYPVSLLFVAGAVTLRFLRAREARRDLLRPMLVTLVVPHLMIALGFLLHGPIRAATDIVAFPTLAMTPLATMVAFARQNIWKSRVLLPRLITRAIIAGIVCILAIGFGTAFAALFDAPFSSALIAASAGAVAASALVVIALRFGDKAFFPSLAEYKPTVEQLSVELTSLAAPEEVVAAVQRTVRRWLPCDTIEFAFEPPAQVRDLALAPAMEQVTHEAVMSAANIVDPDELTLPVVFQGVQLGRLRVGQKRNGALFTSEDLDLLSTIANQGALALAHAIAYAELERRRKQQAAAWRDEREALVETLSAEIAHEIRYPINFFRSIFQRATASRILDEEDLEIGNEEVDRLERLVSGLRRLATQHLERRLSDLSELCDRAEVLLRDRMGDHPLVIDVGDGGAIRCDVDKVTQVVVNLLANALDATEGKGDVGISWRAGPKGGELSVWDTGPGFQGEPSRLFAPWYTTKERGTGLGLAITYRLVRAHGWTIEAMRKDAKTIFVVSVPASDIVSESDRVRTTEVVQSEPVQAKASGRNEGVA